MNYFVIRNLGYDGLMISLFDTKEEAEKEYERQSTDILSQKVMGYSANSEERVNGHTK